jgi:hypothetical protein
MDIKVADFDNDGKTDIAFVNFLSSNLTIYKNNSSIGNIALAPKQDIVVGLGPSDIEIGDLNDDGKIDIAIVCSLANKIQTFRNISTSGQIIFSGNTEVSYPSLVPFSAVIADINRDGKLDISITLHNSGSISQQQFKVLRNTTTTSSTNFSFTDVFTTNQIATNKGKLSVGEVNGDGLPDIVNTSNQNVYLNTSSISTISFYNATFLYTNGATNIKAEVCDLDNDTKPDIILPNNTLSWLTIKSNAIKVPQIFSFTPEAAAYMDTVKIYGANFQGLNQVKFGNVNAKAFTIENESLIKAIVDTGITGFITLANSSNQKISKDLFEFKGKPRVISILPNTGSYLDTITIKGSNFKQGSITQVSFGGKPASYFLVIDVNTIKALPAVNGGSGFVIVRNLYGQDSVNGFSYIPVPYIKSFTPQSTGGNSVVNIYGHNFLGTTSVKFGNINATSFVVLSDTTINAIVSSNGATGFVVVTNNNGVGSKGGFTFIQKPAITSFSPKWFIPAYITNDSLLSIRGNNLLNFTSLKIGELSPSSILIATDTLIKVKLSNAHRSGNIEINTIGGYAYIDSFLFYKVPQITKISPRYITLADTIVYSGMNLTGINKIVFFNKILTSGFSVVGDTLLKLKVPDTLVNGSGGCSVFNPATTNAGAILPCIKFSLGPVIESVNPRFAAANDIVTIKGKGLAGNINDYAVSFDAVKSTIVSKTDSTLLVRVPRSIANEVYIKVFNKLTKRYGRSIVTFNQSFLGGAGNITSTSFSNPISISADSNLLAWYYVDFDEDGLIDILVVTPQKLTYYKNISTQGDIRFNPVDTLSINTTATSFVLEDFDNDGKTDIIGVKSTGVFFYKNNGLSNYLSFNAPVYITSTPSVAWEGSVGSFDLDNDGRSEIILYPGSIVASYIYILENKTTNGVVSFNSTIFNMADGNADAERYIASSKFIDFNNDLLPDFISIVKNKHNNYSPFYFNLNKSFTNTNDVYVNTKFAGKVGPTYIGMSNLSSVVIADFDNNGNDDLLSREHLLKNLDLSYDNTGNISYVNFSGVSYPLSPMTISYTYPLGADINGDSKLEYFIQGYIGGQNTKLYILSNTSTLNNISFDTIPINLPELPYYNKSVDLDGDSRPEIIYFVPSSPKKIFILRNQINTIATSSIPLQSIQKAIKVYPNPANNLLFINHPTALSKTTISITDLYGRVVLIRDVLIGSKQTSFNINELPKGYYGITLKSKNFNITEKFIKQ